MSWTLDSSGCLTAYGCHLSMVTKKSGDSKSNAMWEEDQTGGSEAFWRFDIEQGKGMWVGVTTSQRFGPGWGLKGFLYGGPGNLSDGSSLAQGGWGPELKGGDTLDMKVNVESDRLTIEFGLNGFYLGKAFDIEGWTGSTDVLRPVVSLDKQGDSLKIRRIDQAQDFPNDVQVPEGDDINGSWVHEGDGQFSLHIKKSGQMAHVSAKVANTMFCSVKFDAEGSKGGACTVQGCVGSTLMMPPPELRELEATVSNMLGSINNITREDGHLIVSSSSSGERRTKFVRAAKVPPATRARINWLN